MREGEAGVSGAESGEGAALVWMEETLGFSDGSQPECHHPFKHFRHGSREDDNAEGRGGVVGDLARFFQYHPVSGVQ